jgi:hypothetical protein
MRVKSVRIEIYVRVLTDSLVTKSRELIVRELIASNG